MYMKNYYLYVAPVKGEENSIKQQLESGNKYILSKWVGYKAVVTEPEEEMSKPIAEREGFNSFQFADLPDRNIIVIDISILNNMGRYDLEELKSRIGNAEITVISDGRFVSAFGCDYPSPIRKCISKKAYDYNNKKYFRSFNNVVAYCCRPYGFEQYKIGPFTLAEYYASMVMGTHNLVIYDEPYAFGDTVISERKCFTQLINSIMVGEYDLVIIFKRDFRTDELDIAVGVIRKYIPVILNDNDDKFTFLDTKKEEFIYV